MKSSGSRISRKKASRMPPKRLRVVSNAYLPLEIIYGILLLLSPRNLVQLMCVSRSWRNLIRDPKFVQEYYLKNSASKGDGFLLYVSMFDGQGMSFNLLNDKTFDVDSRLRIPPVNQWQKNIRIVGSCNGVVCLSEIQFFGFSIYISNPSIGKYKIINPSSTIKIWLVTDMILGFAYHSQVDDFKVVRIAYGTFRNAVGGVTGAVANNVTDYDICVEVYSLSSNSWKAIDVTSSFPWYIYQSSSDVFLNESLHWIARDGGIAGGERVILAFDLKEEVFKEVLLPQENEAGEVSKFLDFIGVLRGELAAFTYSPNKFGSDTTERCELWVMKEYENEDSWNKLYTVRLGIGIERPLKITNNEEVILLDDQQRVLVYSFSAHLITYLGITSPRSNFVSFTKSLALID